jgi:Lrp/AsnC family transcriptional regulator
MEKILDEAERRILRELQRDSSRPIAQVAETVGLSHAPCWRRVQRLRAEGYIEREAALLNWHKLGWELELFVFVKASPHGRANVEEFRRTVMSHDRVIGYYIMLGNWDAMLHVVAKNTRDYNEFYLKNLATLPHISEINSMTVLSQLKDADIPV